MIDIPAFITPILTQANQICLKSFSNVKSTTVKQDQSNIVTQADLEVEKFIVSQIQANFPQDTIIAEETGFKQGTSNFQWTIDPIDGTSNFAACLPWFGILIARLQNWQPINAGISLPALDQLYLATKDQGAQLNDHPIHTTPESQLKNSLIAYGIDYSPENQKTQQELAIIHKIVAHSRNLRSTNSVFDFCAVATGKYGGYINQASKIWDNTAPYLLIKESGGKYTDITGQLIDFTCTKDNYPHNFTFIAASKPIHPQILKLIQS